MNISKILPFASVAFAASVLTAAPTVGNVSLAQAPDRTVTVTYTLSDGPAVVTFAIEMKDADGQWVEVQPSDVCRAQGDVWKLVGAGAPADKTYTITYLPSLGSEWAAPKDGVRAVVTAWPTDDPPDYMVVDLTQNSPRRVTYFQSKEYVPGGVLSNFAYRTTAMLMRKIPAKNVTWWMGSSTSGVTAETPHQVTLSENYYLACFPLTQAQYRTVTGSAPSVYFGVEGGMRPLDQLSYSCVRETAYNVHTGNSSYYYPAKPYAWSLLGRLTDRTGVDFDLPSEAQWEYACRAGVGDGYWNTGKSESNASDMPGRYSGNGGQGGRIGTNWFTHDTTVGPDKGTAIVGSYDPNAWGLYDMHGNTWELCLDWYADDITSLNGAVNAAGANLADGKTAGATRVRRGGNWISGASDARCAYRSSANPTGAYNIWNNIRPACPAVAK